MLDTLCWTLLLGTLAWHFCWTLLLDILAWHSFLTLLLDTLSWHSFLTHFAGHSCLTLLLDTLSWHFCWTLFLDTLSWHSCLTLFHDTLAWHSFLTLLLDTLAGHSCWTLLLDTLAGRSCLTFLLDTLDRTLLLDTLAWHFCWTLLTGHSCLTLFLDTLSWHSCLTLLLDTLAWHSFLTLLLDTPFPRDFPQKWQSNLPKRAFYTRLSPKVTIQASKTSIFQETFTKSDDPSFQNERFTRDISQKRISEQTLCIANPNGTARFNASKTPLGNCKSQYNCDANVSLSRNPAPVQRNHLFQSSSLQCAAPATKKDFRHFPQDMQNCNFS